MQRPFRKPNWKLGLFLGALYSIAIIHFTGIDDSSSHYGSVGLSLVAQMGIVLSFFYRESARLEKLLMDRGGSVGEMPLKREKRIGHLVVLIGVVMLLTAVGYGFPEDFGVLLFFGVWGVSIIIGALFYYEFTRISKMLTNLNLDQTTDQLEQTEKDKGHL